MPSSASYYIIPVLLLTPSETGGSPSFQAKFGSCRSECGEEWKGGPLDKKGQHHCHAERSEASARHWTETLRCAQGDNKGLSSDGCRPDRIGPTDEVLMIRVLLVDDQSVVRRALRVRFHLEPDLEVVGEASTGTEALTLAQTLTPDVVLMDIEMPEMDGIEAIT